MFQHQLATSKPPKIQISISSPEGPVSWRQWIDEVGVSLAHQSAPSKQLWQAALNSLAHPAAVGPATITFEREEGFKPYQRGKIPHSAPNVAITKPYKAECGWFGIKGVFFVLCISVNLWIYKFTLYTVYLSQIRAMPPAFIFIIHIHKVTVGSRTTLVH